MQQLAYFVRVFSFALLLGFNPLPGHAQVVEPDAGKVTQPTPSGSSTRRSSSPVSKLTKALAVGQATREAPATDSLLARARQLGHVPSQIVALSQLAAIRLQEQETEQAAELLQEAEQLVEQLRGPSDIGWTLGMVGSARRRLSTSNPTYQGQLAPLMKSLSYALTSNRDFVVKVPDVDVPDIKVPDIKTPDASAGAWYRGAGSSAANKQRGGRNALEAEAGSAARLAGRRAQAAVEQLLDTLLTTKANPPQLVRRLTAKRKLRDSSEALSKAYAQKGNYAQAYQYFLKYNAYKDSLTAEATTRRLAELEYRQNLLRKEAQIQRLNKERVLREQAAHRQQQFVLALIGGIAVLGGFAVVLTRNNRLKQRANLRLQEQQAALERAIEELRRTQAQLVESEKMASLGELTAGIAHEIQNPLNFVTNFAEVSAELVQELADEQAGAARDAALEAALLGDLRQNLAKIHHHGQRAAGIVRGMLEHARASAGERAPVDVNALCDEYLRLAYHGLRAKDKGFHAALEAAYAPDLPAVSAAGGELGRVLLNLFTNAFHAVRQRQQAGEAGYAPAVGVSTRRAAGRVEIRVTDNGTGIAEAVRAKIFQPFFTTKPAGEGTGLGLSLSYDIVTKGHGGALTVDSRPGQGSTFTVTLPINNVATELTKPAAATVTPQ